MEKTKEAIDEVIRCINNMWENLGDIVTVNDGHQKLENQRLNMLRWAKDLKITFQDEVQHYGKSSYMEAYKALLADAKELYEKHSSLNFKGALELCIKTYLAVKAGGLLKDE